MAEHVTITGDHETFGSKLGQLKKLEINQILESFKASELYRGIQELLRSNEGQRLLQQLKNTTKHHCPQYVAELQGMATGACESFDDLFLLNIDCDLQAHLEILPGHSHDVTFRSLSDGCTNLTLQTSDEQVYFVHTEDINPEWVKYGLMITADISAEIPEKWTDYVIPGVLPGSKFGFNDHGLMFAHNNIYQKGCNERGIPRKFLCRSLLRCKTVEEVKETLLREPGIATAYNVQVIKVDVTNGQTLVSNKVIEVAGGRSGTVCVEFEPRGFYFHCNTFQHLSCECHPEESSVHRLATLSQYVNRRQASTLTDLKTMISDQSDKVFPIYRTGTSPDYLATAATGIFDTKEMKLYVYSGMPATTNEQHVFTIPQHGA